MQGTGLLNRSAEPPVQSAQTIKLVQAGAVVIYNVESTIFKALK